MRPRRELQSTLTILAFSLFLTPMAIMAKKDKDHHDAFMPEEANEAQIMKEVRHQLLLLPYYGVFDDIAFKAEGGAITLMGAVTRPTLKSDAEGVVKRVEVVFFCRP